MKGFWEELKRRNVIKSAIAYVVVAWVLLQVLSIVLPALGAPEWVMKTVLLLVLLCFPLWLLFSWAYNISSNDIKSSENSQTESLKIKNRLNSVIIGALSIAVAILLFKNINDNNSDKDNDSAENLRTISLAVLPFEDLSQNNDQEYFSDGISTELNSLLVKMKVLKVIDPRSSFSFKGKNVTIREIAEQLNVTHVLDGSVRKSGEKVRVVVQLIDADNGTSVWNHTFNREMGEIFSLQDEIAKAVIDELKIVLGSESNRQFNQRPTSNIEAYNFYLEALYYINLSGFENVNKALALLEQAINLDSNFANAYALLAKTYILNNIDLEFKEEWNRKAYVAIQKALTLDPNLAEVYVARGMWYWSPNNNFDHEHAIRDFNKAIELNPGLSSAYQSLLLVQLHIGLLDYALKSGEMGLNLDPTNTWLKHFVGQVYYFKGDYDNALKMYESIPYQFIPFFRIALTAQTLNYKGEIDEAIEMVEKGLLEYPNEPQLNSTYAIFLATKGQEQKALEYMQNALNNQTLLRHVHHLYHNFASISALLGNKEEALYWLNKAADSGMPCYPLFKNDPNLNSLDGYKPFEEFLNKLIAERNYYKNLFN
ncbi:TPR end-of-group domain-containing protein [Aestuariivivens sediminicola]|uniref:TPR end-of-group domain-containing protein n=1 Tax=Aestuariivivens sediminicola TaxID=2913560 RepID=UPI001F57E754|nr:hypothetical protein [Aestuariivivens sediminicola]